MQVAAAAWLLFWAAALAYHLWVAGYFGARTSDQHTDFMVVHIGAALQVSLAMAAATLLVATVAKPRV